VLDLVAALRERIAAHDAAGRACADLAHFLGERTASIFLSQSAFQLSENFLEGLPASLEPPVACRALTQNVVEHVREKQPTLVQQHAVAVAGNGVDKAGQTVMRGGTSTVSVTVKPGKYDYYCPGARPQSGGIKGTLTVTSLSNRCGPRARASCRAQRLPPRAACQAGHGSSRRRRLRQPRARLPREPTPPSGVVESRPELTWRRGYLGVTK
jgi:hypothetical protein